MEDQGAALIIRFEGITSPEAAAALKGAEIIAGREFAAPLEKGEFYIEDLKGLLVTGADEKVLGQISDIIEGGNGSLAEVLLPSNKKVFVPWRKEFFGEVDFKAGKIKLLEPWILDT